MRLGGKSFRFILWLVAFGLVLVFAWQLALVPIFVQARAGEYAEDAPFCIQVRANRYDYRPATQWWDLTGFAMAVPQESGGGSQGYQWTFHAVLVVARPTGVELSNWSYRAMAFVPIGDETARLLRLAIRCTPANG